jgi:inner membrane protein
VDNVTHTLAGIVIAEVVLAVRSRRSGRDPQPSLSRAAWLASAGANNVPDLDFLYAGIVERPLGYLLHHRGHTHTFALAPLVAILPFAAAVLLERWSARRAEPGRDAAARAPDRTSWPLLYGLSLLGCITHVLMDATNNYGVHPLWPFDGHWMYGDTIFIVEPLWWVVLSAPLLFTPKARWGRALFALPPIAAIVLAIGTRMVLPPFVAVLGALTPLLFVASRRATRPVRAATAAGLGVLVLVVFAVGGAGARARAEAELHARHPDEALHDVVLSPMPGNPFCWSGLTVQSDERSLHYRRIAVSTWPSAFTAEGCHVDPPREVMAPRVPITEPSGAEVQFFDTLSVPLDRMRALAREDCRVAAYLVFSRAPFVVEAYDGTLLGDARYDMSRDTSWSKMRLSEEIGACPGWVPGWEPPRADLLPTGAGGDQEPTR